MFETLRSGRLERHDALGCLLLFQGGQRSVQFALAGLYRRGGSQHCPCSQEAPPGGVHFLFGGRLLRLCDRLGLRFAPADEPVADGALVAILEAVHTDHAAGVVDPVFGRIDAGRLAFARADGAAVAFVRVNHGFVEGIFRKQPEERTHRTDGVAPGASAAPGQDENQCEEGRRSDEGRQALDVNLCRIECVAVPMLGNQGQQVVHAAIDGGEKFGGDPAEGAVGLDQRCNGGQAAEQKHDEDGQQAVAQPVPGGAVTVAGLFLFARKPADDVLRDAQRAEDRAVDAAENEGQQYQCDDHAGIERQDGRHQLDSGQCAEPGVERPREVEKQEGQQGEGQGRQDDSDFLEHKAVRVRRLPCKDRIIAVNPNYFSTFGPT